MQPEEERRPERVEEELCEKEGQGDTRACEAATRPDKIRNSGSDWAKLVRPFFRRMKFAVCLRFHALWANDPVIVRLEFSAAGPVVSVARRPGTPDPEVNTGNQDAEAASPTERSEGSIRSPGSLTIPVESRGWTV